LKEECEKLKKHMITKQEFKEYLIKQEQLEMMNEIEKEAFKTQLHHIKESFASPTENLKG
jgi:thioredoxin-related protein